MMEYGRKYTLKHGHFGEIATFERLPEESGLRFRCTARNWYCGNLAAEWLRRRMEEKGLSSDKRNKQEFPKWCRCHSRERYKRLLMACGFDRHAATLWCGFVQTTRIILNGNFSYQEAWLSFIFSTVYIEVRE